MAGQANGPPPALERRIEAIIFDWDGTAVPDRSADASELRCLVEALCAEGMEVAVVSGTGLDNVDGQLSARPAGPGSLHLLLNRGSEVFRVGEEGPELADRRVASREEEAGLDRAAELAIEDFARSGLEVEVVSRRLNRRKLDLIPLAGMGRSPRRRGSRNWSRRSRSGCREVESAACARQSSSRSGPPSGPESGRRA